MKFGQLAGAFMNGFFHGFRNAGIKEQQVDFFFVFVPFPDADDTAVENDRRERIIDQLALPSGERFVRMFRGNESIDDFALAFEIGVAIRNEVDGGFRRFESQKMRRDRLR